MQRLNESRQCEKLIGGESAQTGKVCPSMVNLYLGKSEIVLDVVMSYAVMLAEMSEPQRRLGQPRLGAPI